MHHGGPYPACSTPLFTSVGASAIARFARPLCFQVSSLEYLYYYYYDTGGGDGGGDGGSVGQVSSLEYYYYDTGGGDGGIFIVSMMSVVATLIHLNSVFVHAALPTSQDWPEVSLPPELQDANPLGALRLVNGEYTRDALRPGSHRSR